MVCDSFSMTHLFWPAGLRQPRLSDMRLFFLFPLLFAVVVVAKAEPPPAEKGSPPTAEQTLARLQLAEGLKAELVAAEPMLRHPICFWIDPKGKMYVCESDRLTRGVLDNRRYAYWIDDDLAARTVADREAFYKKHLGKSLEEFTKYDDRIRLLVDTDDDLKMDQSFVFADGFNGLVQGAGAGVLAIGDDVYYTCIPDLWKLKDTDGDGKSDKRESLHTGYGVHVAFRGHDMHGLIMGPDGRLYFSIGDRGYNVRTAEKHLVNTDSGAVLRCWPDGSGLEEFVTGLRNPQELAFDSLGNLFTCDNNSDYGDISRWTFLAPGGDAGWRFAYQYKMKTGPWLREQMWLTYSDKAPASQLPVIANIADGPAGLTVYPGTAMGAQFRGKFFVSDFRGDPSRSGVRSFRVRPKGAFFEASDLEKPVWGALTTDVDFGPDGAMYVSDWVESWDGIGVGRIYRIFDPDKAEDPLVLETAALLRSGFADLAKKKLSQLLAHPDQRVRQGAQFELARRGAQETLIGVLESDAVLLARLHALWGLGQIARREPKNESLQNIFVQALSDREPEIRGRAAELAGELGLPARVRLEHMLSDSSPRARYFAALALGHLATGASLESVVRMVEENNNTDPVLRHAGVMALAKIGSEDAEPLYHLAEHHSAAVRMAVLLALRRLKDPRVAAFLTDPQQPLAVEAARAIYDVPIREAWPILAKEIASASRSELILRRALVANYRLGTSQHADAVARFAADTSAGEALRLEALELLSTWTNPENRDPFLGYWWPLEPRDPEIAAGAVRKNLAGLLAAQPAVRAAALKLAADLEIEEAAEGLLVTFRDQKADSMQRGQALRALAALESEQLERLIEAGLADPEPAVRIVARELLAARDPEAALVAAEEALGSGEIQEQQATLDLLGKLPPSDQQTALLRKAIEELFGGTLAEQLQLEVLEAAEHSDHADLRKKAQQFRTQLPPQDPLRGYRETLFGGNAGRGRELFLYRTELACVRCHQVEGRGGAVGPDLSRVAAEKTRRYLLTSLLAPSVDVDPRFATWEVENAEGRIVTGLKVADGDQIELLQADGRKLAFPRDEIESLRMIRQSAMPDDVAGKLTRRELRDLVAFLASLRAAPPAQSSVQP